MNTKIAAISAITIVGAVLLLVSSYISAYNLGNRLETTLEATQDNTRNILAQTGNKVSETAQVTGMQRDDLIDVVSAALEGRYGEDGSQAVFQFIQEQNPQVDSAVYVQLQRVIESGRNEFAAAQTVLIDQKRIYETKLGTFWGGTWLSLAGYPKVDLDTIKIVSTEKANEAFETGIDGPMKLR